MPPTSDFQLRQAVAVLATMHGKEQVIAPLLHRSLGLQINVPQDFDTDRFGSFSRDVTRNGSALDAARAKIAAAFERVPQARVGLASEGSFGPHPQIPFLPVGSEIVLLIDRQSGLELSGHHLSPATNFSHQVVHDTAAALAFAQRVGFPRHGVIVMGTTAGKPSPQSTLFKQIDDLAQLEMAADIAIRRHGAAAVESDMRAHRNPTRMRAIKRATIDLLRAWHNRCPICGTPGFVVSEHISGLPCACCGAATQVTMAHVRYCNCCSHVLQQPVDKPQADPSRCDQCNP